MEILIAGFVLVLVLATIYAVYLTGLAFFRSGCKECHLQSRARLAADRLIIGKEVPMPTPIPGVAITDGIRFGRNVEVFDDIYDGIPNSLPAEGDFIKVYYPTATGVGPRGYYFEDGKILATRGTSDAADDDVIIEDVVKMPGVDIFSYDGTTGIVSLNFSVQDDYEGDGYQGIDISTQFYQRN